MRVQGYCEGQDAMPALELVFLRRMAPAWAQRQARGLLDTLEADALLRVCRTERKARPVVFRSN